MNSEWKLRTLAGVQLFTLAIFAAWAFARAVTDSSTNWQLFYGAFAILMTAGLIYRMIRYRQRFKPLL